MTGKGSRKRLPDPRYCDEEQLEKNWEAWRTNKKKDKP